MSQLHSLNHFYSDYQDIVLNKYLLPNDIFKKILLHDNGVGLKKYDVRRVLSKYSDEVHRSMVESFYQ